MHHEKHANESPGESQAKERRKEHRLQTKRIPFFLQVIQTDADVDNFAYDCRDRCPYKTIERNEDRIQHHIDKNRRKIKCTAQTSACSQR